MDTFVLLERERSIKTVSRVRFDKGDLNQWLYINIITVLICWALSYPTTFR